MCRVHPVQPDLVGHEGELPEHRMTHTACLHLLFVFRLDLS